MRLTCPNCGAEYEIPEGMIPPGGKHVQCTGCHTRWFMRGTARPLLSEDQVMQRLETWSPKPRLATVPPNVVQMPAQKPKEPEDFVWETPVQPSPIPSPRPRLDLTPEQPSTPPVPPVRRKFGRGIFAVLVPVSLAVGVYVWKDPLAASVPAAAPILSDYASSVDKGREWLDDRIARLRGPAQN